MCRLLGFAAPTARTVQDVLGADERAVFQDMARLHRDGWGSAWLTGAPGSALDEERTAEAGGSADGSAGPGVSPLALLRSERSGLGDEQLTEALAGDPAIARIVHLRMATDGMACTVQNTHPFVAGELAFGHNGSLVPTDAIEPLVDPDIRATLAGDTDSELYFAAIRSAVARGSSLADAVVDTVSALRPHYPISSLNALLLSPTQLIAIHASDRSPIPNADFDASGLDDTLLPRDHRTAYYLMRWRRFADGTTVFASSGLDIGDWTPLPPESVAVLDLATLELEVRPLHGVAAERGTEALAG